MNTFLGLLVVIDVEKYGWSATDGVTIKWYTDDEIKACKHHDDFPGCNVAVEGPHFIPQTEEDRGRGAQGLLKPEILAVLSDAELRGIIYYRLPARMTTRRLSEMGYEKEEDAYLAWWKYCATKKQIVDEAPVLRLKTEKDERRNQLVKEARRNASNRSERFGALRKKGLHSPEVDICRNILTRAHTADRLTEEIVKEFKIKLPGTKGPLDFESPIPAMTMYFASCLEDGTFRRNTRGNPVGVKAIRSDILQHHPHHSGKGSDAACRAKTRWFRLLPAERSYRGHHPEFQKPEGAKFHPAIPEVRRHHERMNRELIKIFRDFGN